MPGSLRLLLRAALIRFSRPASSGNYNLYACLTIPGVVESRLYDLDTLKPAGETKLQGVSHISGALFKISEEYLQRQDASSKTQGGVSGVAPMRIGISWSSLDKACAFAEEQIHDYEKVADFDAIKDESRRIWNERLQTVDLDITGVEEDHVVNFYSSLYRTFMSPTSEFASPGFSQHDSDLLLLLCRQRCDWRQPALGVD